MKLFTKYNRINITLTIFIFIIGSIAFYFVLQYVLIRQLDETLRGEQQEIADYVKVHNELPSIQNTKQQWISIITSNETIDKPTAKSVLAYNQTENEKEFVRQLVFSLKAGNHSYQITVHKSETETEDLLQLIILVTIGMIGFILLSNYLINRKLITRLWQPFYTTIKSIKDYEIVIQTPLSLSKEPIEEIDLLNESLNKMTLRIHRDYHALRSFTENASHEMQTPLAVIRSKVDALLQDMEGNEKNMQQLLAIEDATQKLARLHQSLLLLTKLENRQFVANEPVNISMIIQTKLEERKELMTAKELHLHVTNTANEVILPFHQHLAEIMVNNLLNNVIRYSPRGGDVYVHLSEEHLVIANAAINGPLNKERIFQRFYKEEQSAESTGLGLSIINEICKIAGFIIKYQFTENKHQFSIQFK